MGKKEKIKCIFTENRVLCEDSNEIQDLHYNKCFGKIENKKIYLSLLEALYLLEKQKIEIIKGRTSLTTEKFIKISNKLQPNFWIRYCVFKDMRDRGYIIKTALKFGADFRVYDRGIKPGEDHAKWIIYPVSESSTLTWHEFSAKNRVAHSTRKRLMIGVVDDENDVTYYEVKWIRP